MSQYQPQQYDPRQAHGYLEARGTNAVATWDGRTLALRFRAGRGTVTVPVRQVASVGVSTLNLAFTVTTTGGRAYAVRYWPWDGAEFRALRDAVLGTVAAMG